MNNCNIVVPIYVGVIPVGISRRFDGRNCQVTQELIQVINNVDYILGEVLKTLGEPLRIMKMLCLPSSLSLLRFQLHFILDHTSRS